MRYDKPVFHSKVRNYIRQHLQTLEIVRRSTRWQHFSLHQRRHSNIVASPHRASTQWKKSAETTLTFTQHIVRIFTQSRHTGYLCHWICTVKITIRRENMREKNQARNNIIQYMRNFRDRQRTLNPHRRQHRIVEYGSGRGRRRPASPPLEQHEIHPLVLCYKETTGLRILTQQELHKSRTNGTIE